MQASESEARLQRAVREGLLSPPQPVALPRDFPFHIATCAVDLPKGCLPPPGALSRRLAAGCGWGPAEAARLALFEGVERYSLQYQRDMPAALTPFAAAGGAGDPAPVAALALGVPGAAAPASSKGAAAGVGLESAARRAVLELLEHHHAGAPAGPSAAFRRVDPAAVGPLATLASWLDGRYRLLDLRLASFDGYFVAIAGASDLDGGRRTEGAAAGLGLFDTLVDAAVEAVFHWRNMVALDYAGTAAETLCAEDRAALRRYRGAAGPVTWPKADGAAAVDGDSVLATSTAELMSALVRTSGLRVRLFDMTNAAIGLPVVKALAG